MQWIILGGLAVITGALLWLSYRLAGRSTGRLAKPGFTSHTRLQKTPLGYSGHSRGLAVQVETVGWGTTWRYTYALELPPLLRMAKAPNKLPIGVSLRWDALTGPGRSQALQIRAGALHGEAYSIQELSEQLDSLSAILVLAEAPTRALFEGLQWNPAGLKDASQDGVLARRGQYKGRQMLLKAQDPTAIFRIEHRLNLHPEFRLGVGVDASHKTGDAVLDMLLGCQSPNSADLAKLSGHSELLLACLHPRPSWRLHGGHLFMCCEGPLEQVLGEVALALDTLTALEAAE